MNELQPCFVCHGQFDPNGMLLFTVGNVLGTFFACMTHDDEAIWAAGAGLRDPDRLPLAIVDPFDPVEERRAAGEANAMRQSAALTVGNGRAPAVHRGGRPPQGTEPYDPTSILEDAEQEAAMEAIADGLDVPLELVTPLRRRYIIASTELFERGLVAAADVQASFDRVTQAMGGSADQFSVLASAIAHTQDEAFTKNDLNLILHCDCPDCRP